MAQQNKPLMIAGAVVVFVAVLQFFNNIQTASIQSSFSFGEFFSQQPVLVQSLAIWLGVGLLGVILLFKAGGGNKVM